ncbi:MAG: lysylphosphatidylglycerol synthase transmembrane domain-containing protein [Candidatus Caldatribacteriota bacterium]|nr:lysylphosphatidylglycerol synthase transmembrane domain-containing protein [Candidatus Caldatribacteriota bacterium]
MNELILNKKKLLRGLVISILIGIITILFVFFITTNQETWASLSSINKNYIILAFVAMLFAAIIDALRIKTAVEAVNEKISFLEALKIYYISNFVGGITPFFSGTLPTQIYLFNKNIQHTMPLGKATMVATIIPVLKTIVFTVFAPIIFFSFRKTITNYNTLPLILINTAILFSLLVLFLFFISVKYPQKMIKVIHKIQNLSCLSIFFKNKKVLFFSNKLIIEIKEFQQSFNLLKENWIKISLSMFFTIIFWGTFFTIAPLILWGLGIKFNLSHILLMQIIFYFILPYMPTPGGSGTAEVSFASLFSFFVPNYLLGLFVSIWRFIFFYFNLIIGLIVISLEIKKMKVRERKK